MPKRSTIIYPKIKRRLQIMGEQIKLARLRRHLTASLVAERAGISRATLAEIEKGNPRVSIGTVATVLACIGGLDEDIEKLARDDPAGQMYRDLELVTPKRGTQK